MMKDFLFKIFILTVLSNNHVEDAKEIFLFKMCYTEHENEQCSLVLLTSESKILEPGSKVKIFNISSLIAEGVIVNHINHGLMILDSLQQGNDKSILGGCADGYMQIDLESKTIISC